MQITHDELQQLDDRYRANLINSLSGFKSANLIGTVDKQGRTNLAIVSSVFHLGANPPLLGMISRPHSVARHTLDNILAIGEYTINHVNAAIWTQAHQTSARFPREISEFDAVGLSAQWHDGVKAPFVAESRLKYALKLRSHQTIDLNGVVLLIGEVTQLHVEQGAVTDSGYIDIAQLGSVAVSGLDSYHTAQNLGRLSYAKPDKVPQRLD
uniref:flavin reductase family protein n=1 Tax=Thaumasiovibrio occultus TaxID=1891184 RepID=UPI000B359C80|nr:flavin reductase family protein [Thaumasiovibrio occultus]